MKHRVRTLSLRDQKAWFREYLPLFACSVVENELTCRGTLQPTPLSQIYSAVIFYIAGSRPRVFLPGRQLMRRDPDVAIPHTYSDTEPCLFYRSEWRSDMKIATSIVSWLVLWLDYYEIWRVSGEWLGGGIPHGTVKD